MRKVFARVNTFRRDPNFGKVEIQIRDVQPDTAPAFTTTKLTTEKWCVVPVMIDGVEALCGKPAEGNSHGWFCRGHYLRSTGTTRTSEEAALEKLDNDNIQFIIGQDAKRIAAGESYRLDIPKRWLGKEPPVMTTEDRRVTVQ